MDWKNLPSSGGGVQDNRGAAAYREAALPLAAALAA